MKWLESIPSPYDKLFIAALSIIFLTGGFLAVKNFSQPKETTIPAPRTFNELSLAEQKAVLESLTASDSSRLSPEEKREIIEKGTASHKSRYSPEEMRDILKSLTAPTQ